MLAMVKLKKYPFLFKAYELILAERYCAIHNPRTSQSAAVKEKVGFPALDLCSLTKHSQLSGAAVNDIKTQVSSNIMPVLPSIYFLQ